MSSSQQYLEAVRILNELQPNSVTISNRLVVPPEVRMQNFERYIDTVGLTQDNLRSLNIIHVSGTKGKGSVCAFAESILRSCGFKTGFFSSPHLIDMVERIRINGNPVEHELFSRVLIECYDALWAKRENDADLPAYFAFLTLLAFKIFSLEKVDVAVIEVGMGGKYDPTNVIQHPVVCGVTSLGYDHQKVLGYTIEEIAWNKAGIFKPGVPAFTYNQPYNGALSTLQSCAKDVGSNLQVINVDQKFLEDFTLGLDGSYQAENAKLALKLCECWADKVMRSKLPREGIENGFRLVQWPGRCQTIELRDLNMAMYLDGAHTDESLKQCKQWFQSKLRHNSGRKDSNREIRVLICTFTGDRDDQILVQTLAEDRGLFDHVVFTPPCLDEDLKDLKSVRFNAATANTTNQTALLRCEQNRKYWHDLDSNRKVHVTKCVDEALTYIFTLAAQMDATDYKTKLSVLVTGSLYLVGAFLKLINQRSTQDFLAAALP